MARWRTPAEMGRPLTPAERLENLTYHMTHCWKCDTEHKWGAPVCEHCGQELMQHGKN